MRNIVLQAVHHPDTAVLMLAAGGLLICLEFNRPGWVVPGTLGLLLVMLAMWGLQQLEISSLGLVLTGIALALVLLGSRLPGRPLWAGLGICALPAGLEMLVKASGSEAGVSRPAALAAGLTFGVVAAVLMEIGMRARRHKRMLGTEAVLGRRGIAHMPLAPEGRVLIAGELWRARLSTGSVPVAAGASVRVVGAEGRVLEVSAAEAPEG